MKRRELLTLGTSAAAFLLAGRRPALADLEPDGLWSIYRRYRLFILGQRDDETGGTLAGAAADVLARALPDSRTQLAHATDTRRVGVLIGTGQQDLAIMTAGSAEALFHAKPPFADIRNVPLRLIVSFGTHVLVCRLDFAARHAFLLAKTLAAHREALPAPASAPEGIVPAHQGSHAFFAGEEMPVD
jgi:hypothetical protein